MAGDVHERVMARWAATLEEAAVTHATLVLVAPPERLLELVGSLRKDFGFDLLLDVTAVDWPEREPRFDVVYHLYSTRDFK